MNFELLKWAKFKSFNFPPILSPKCTLEVRPFNKTSPNTQPSQKLKLKTDSLTIEVRTYVTNSDNYCECGLRIYILHFSLKTKQFWPTRSSITVRATKIWFISLIVMAIFYPKAVNLYYHMDFQREVYYRNKWLTTKRPLSPLPWLRPNYVISLSLKWKSRSTYIQPKKRALLVWKWELETTNIHKKKNSFFSLHIQNFNHF